MPTPSARAGWTLCAIALLAGTALTARAAAPDIALSGNDNHTTVVDGKPRGLANAKPDNVSVIDVSSFPPRLVATVDVPFSDIGPPMAIAIGPDASYALVTASTKADPGAPDGASPDDRVSVLDLTVSPPRVVQTVHAGTGATAVRITPDGTMALVTNRNAGTISVFTIADRRLSPAGTVDLGNPKSIPQGLIISRDGKTALVSRTGDNTINVLHIAGTTITVDPRPLTAGFAPDTMDLDAAGDLAVVTSVGRGDGDVDTVSLIDMKAAPPRVIDAVPVPSGPESAKFSPDGSMLAVISINGSIKAPGNIFYHDQGMLTLYAVQPPEPGAPTQAGRRLKRLAEAPAGGWAQGVAFSRDGGMILAQNFRDHKLIAFRWQNGALGQAVTLDLPGGPAAFATPWP